MGQRYKTADNGGEFLLGEDARYKGDMHSASTAPLRAVESLLVACCAKAFVILGEGGSTLLVAFTFRDT